MYSLFQKNMSYHKVELDFEQNLVKTRSHNIESSTARKKCYQFSVVKDVVQSANAVQLKQEKIITKPWLYGPATCLKSRTIFYPCKRGRCSIPCPCLLCAYKKHPSCRVASSQGCPCENCRQHFADHVNFHAVFHYGCKFCFQIIQSIPCFNFSALDFKKKLPVGGCFDSNSDLDPYFVWPDHKLSVKFTDMWCSKRKKWLNDEEDGSDMWCRHCNLLFWSFDALVKHMRSHHLFTKTFRHYWRNCLKTEDSNDTKCYQCSKRFSSVSDLQKHIDAVHYGDSYDCEICGVKFSRSENLARHKTVKHMEPHVSTYACTDCGKRFSRSDNLERHAAVVHSSSLLLFRCETCGKKFNRKDNFTRHIENIFSSDGSPRYKCIYCGQQFCTELLLKAHGNLCQSEDESKSTKQSSTRIPDTMLDNANNFICFVCSESFEQKSILVQHRKLAHEDILECNLCHSNFKSRFALERHEKDVFSNGSPRYECKHCTDYFCNGKQLKKHISNKHHSCICQFCDQRFSKESNLKLHLKKRIQNFVGCSYCGKSLCNKVQLTTHVLKEHRSPSKDG
jgi:stress-induced morphogen